MYSCDRVRRSLLYCRFQFWLFLMRLTSSLAVCHQSWNGSKNTTTSLSFGHLARVQVCIIWIEFIYTICIHVADIVLIHTYLSALAGLRVGYGSFPLGMIEYLWRAKQVRYFLYNYVWFGFWQHPSVPKIIHLHLILPYLWTHCIPVWAY